MSKNILYVGFGLTAGLLVFLAWRFFNTPTQVYSTTSTNPNSQPSNGNMNAYPFMPETQPRLDNSNQPWFNNNRSIIMTAPSVDPALQAVQTASSYLKAFNDINENAGALWDDVSAWFDSGDDSGLIFEDSYNWA